MRRLLVLLALWASLTPGVGLAAPSDPTDQAVKSALGDLPSGIPADEEAKAESRLGSAAFPGRTIVLPGAVNAKDYRLGPGDVLMLEIWGGITRDIPLTVGPEGTLLLPGMGPYPVAGKTLDKVRDEVLARMSQQFRKVQMDLRLARARTFRVYLTGEVKAPGPTEANGTSRVSDIVLPALLKDGASTRRLEVRHRDGTRENADLGLFFATGETRDDPWLRDGDVIVVPAATEFIHLLGALARPGRYEIGPDDSLLTMLKIAGDPLPSAAVDRVLHIRWNGPFLKDSVWVSLSDIYSRKYDPPVQDGERLYVSYLPEYRVQKEATILGEVQRPGVYPIVEGRTRLTNLVTAAHGFLPFADLSAIRIYRRNPTAGEKDPELDRLLRLSRNDLTSSEYEILQTKLASLREDYRVDWRRLQRDKELDLLLRNGDIMRVDRLVSSIRVDGEVRRPGILSFVQGQDVDAYVRQAGGFTDRAWRGKVRVRRAVTGQILLARNVRALDPGDFVWVPEKPDRTVWEQARDVLTALASVATVIIAIRSVR